MLVGHFAVAFAAKRIEPQISLGTLVLATMFLDILWLVFTTAGIEAVLGSLIFFLLLIAWAYWMNRARPAKT